MSEFNGILESLISDGEAIANEGLKETLFKVIGVKKKHQVTNASNKTEPKQPEIIDTLKEKYNLNDQSTKKNFKDKLLRDTETKIKKMVAVANKDKVLFDSLKKKIIDEYGEEEKYLISQLKPGYFTAEEEGDYWVIIENQEVAIECDLHYQIAEALNKLKSTDDRYNFIHFSNGDGDEGCVYYTWKYI